MKSFKTTITKDLINKGIENIFSVRECIGALTLKKALEENSIKQNFFSWGARNGHYSIPDTRDPGLNKFIRVQAFLEGEEVSLMNYEYLLERLKSKKSLTIEFREVL